MIVSRQIVFKLRRLAAPGLACVLVWGLSACSLLSPVNKVQSTHYTLDNNLGGAGPNRSTPPDAVTPATTLIINPPRAASGFDSQRIIYVREAHKLEYFSHNEWVDPPARMLGPLMASAIERSGAFGAVVLSAGTAAGEWRLDTEIVRLQQEFITQPSRVRFTLRATVVEDKTRRVLAWREFDASVPSASDDPQGGVAAANQAVQIVLKDLSQFLIEVKK
jgi:cholesterol transport system auxiliary component